MKVKELLTMPGDIDVYDDVCEELAIAFCGPMELTEEGEKEFAEALDLECHINPNSYGNMPAVIIHCDDDEERVWEHRLSIASALFYSMAGYCSEEDYETWFKEV